MLMLSHYDIIVSIPFPFIPVLLFPLPPDQFFQLRFRNLHRPSLSLQRPTTLPNNPSLLHLSNIEILSRRLHNLSLRTKFLSRMFRIILPFAGLGIKPRYKCILSRFWIVDFLRGCFFGNRWGLVVGIDEGWVLS